MGASALRAGPIGTGMMGVEHMLDLRLPEDPRLVAAADP